VIKTTESFHPPRGGAGGVTKLSELQIDQTDRVIATTPLTIPSGTTRKIPSGHHAQITTAHGNKLAVDGTLEVDGSLLFMDLGE